MQTRKINSFVFCLFSFVLILSSCKRSTEPVYNPQNLQLKVLDVSCTEAWLSLQAKSDYLNKTLKLFKDDKLILEKPLATEDSLLYVDGLWPNTGYAFKAAVYEGAELLTKSVTVTATTMDTTSHNFEWQTFEFGGEGGSSSFYDVAIIDENDIWAVGEIYTANDKYNAAHWDGEKWELKKVPSIICGNNSPIQSAIFTVYSFSSNDVWFSDGAELIHYNGYNFKQDCSINTLLTGRINKIWGTSSSDLYVVGNSGLIAHYDGQKWQRIESPEGASGTEFNFHDIWSDINFYSGKREILAVASVFEYNRQGKQVVRIENKNVSNIDTTGLPDALQSIWFKSGRIYYIGGDGLYQKKLNTNFSKRWYKINDLPRLYKNAIRGTDINNIFVVGAYGLISHFNGKTWFNYNEKNLPLIYGSYYALALTNSIVVAVGFKDEGGFIIMGLKK
ncbi:glucosyl transferase [Calditrichota bacterium LG25]